jgi:hypothetical protein
MGAHRSSLSQESQVSAAALALDIINGKGKLPLKEVRILLLSDGGTGELIHLDKDQSNDTWLAASTSLGLLGIIARVKFAVVADFKVYADQTMLVVMRPNDTAINSCFTSLDEDEVLETDIYAQISPYVTANYWARSVPSPIAKLVLKVHVYLVVAWPSEISFTYIQPCSNRDKRQRLSSEEEILRVTPLLIWYLTVNIQRNSS